MEEKDRIKLLIADDHEIYRDGLKLMLRKQKDMVIVDEAGDGQELVQLAKKHEPHVILTDIKMPRLDGIAATKIILEHNDKIAVIALSMFNEDSLLVDMLEAGAKGYLLKNADKKEIIDAIKAVYEGEPYYCKHTNMRLSKIMSSVKTHTAPTETINFSEKEMEVIALTCQEKSNKEIAEQMCVSYRTVEGYKQKILDKMDVKSSAGIVIYAVKHKLINMNGD
jgi:DNA-binding NarL/FixJ family response regulator